MNKQQAGYEGVRVAADHRDRWNGMVRILVFVGVSLATLFLTDSVVDGGLRRIKTSSFGVFNRIVNGEINAAIVISGSSRTLNHFDPRVIEDRTGLRTFNIGINGSQTDMQVAVFKTYLQHNSRPSVLIHGLDSFTFVTSRRGLWFPAQYQPYLNEEPLYEALSSIDPNTWKSRYLPLYGYAVQDMNFTWWTGMRGLFGWNPPEDRYNGFQPRYASWDGDFARFKERNPAGVRVEIDPEGVRSFEEMLRLCQELGVRVVLVYSPVYYEMQALEQNRELIFRQFQEIARRYGAPLWDYSRSPISFRRDFFVNSEHLNAEGAAAFSADLATELARSGLLASR